MEHQGSGLRMQKSRHYPPDFREARKRSLALAVDSQQVESRTQRVRFLGGFGGFLPGFSSLLEPDLATAEKACRLSTAGAT